MALLHRALENNTADSPIVISKRDIKIENQTIDSRYFCILLKLLFSEFDPWPYTPKTAPVVFTKSSISVGLYLKLFSLACQRYYIIKNRS